MLAEKELQGHQPMKMKTSFNIYGPIQDCYTFGSSFLKDEFGFTTSFHVIDTLYNSASCYDPSKASALQGVGAAKPSSSTIPTGLTSDIKCHH
jgi:hypothetical protein